MTPEDEAPTGRKPKIAVTIDPAVKDFIDGLVESGRAPSASAVVNDAVLAKMRHTERVRSLWADKLAQAKADPVIMDRVARMVAHVDEQLNAHAAQQQGGKIAS